MTQQPNTVNEVARRFGVSRYAVYAWIKQGRLGHLRFGRAIRVPETEVERILQSGFRAATRPFGASMLASLWMANSEAAQH